MSIVSNSNTGKRALWKDRRLFLWRVPPPVPGIFDPPKKKIVSLCLRGEIYFGQDSLSQNVHRMNILVKKNQPFEHTLGLTPQGYSGLILSGASDFYP